MKLLAALLLTLTALSQDLPEIRGIVHEYGTNAAVAGAEITLFEFVAPEGPTLRQQVATVYTNAGGTFSFKPFHAGDYFVEARKPSYLTGDELEALGWISGHELVESALGVAADGLPRDIAFTLIRPGGLTGRIVDENDKPVSGFTMIATSPATPRRDRITTGEDGVFLFPKLVPDPRVVRIGPAESLLNFNLKAAGSPFTKEEIARIDQDIETTYWPGGVSDPALALPIRIIPGTVQNLGTIRLRKVPYYRLFLTYQGECASKEAWIFTNASTNIEGLAQCNKEVLLDKLRPGEHTLAVFSSGTQTISAPNKWALLEFSIDRENIQRSFVFTPVMNISGHVVNARGNKLPAFENTKIALRPHAGNALFVGPLTVSIDPQGNFTFPKVHLLHHQIFFPILDPGVVVKEIRYANQPVPDGKITVSPGAQIEIVVDDQPASLSGTAPPRTMIYLARWPYVPQQQAPYNYMTRSDETGLFQIHSLAAGEYRAVAVPSDTAVDPAAMGFLLSAASRITIERGKQKTVQLK